MNKRALAALIVMLWNTALFVLLGLGAVTLFLLAYKLPALTSLILLSVAATSFIGVGAIALLDIFVYTHGLDGVVRLLTRTRGREHE